MPLLGAFMSLASWAMPAKPGKVVMTQPDGTKIEAYVRGDEWFSYYETLDGKVLMPAADGTLKYAEIDASGNVVPGDVAAGVPSARGMREARAARAADASALRAALVSQAERARRAAA